MCAILRKGIFNDIWKGKHQNFYFVLNCKSNYANFRLNKIIYSDRVAHCDVEVGS